MDSTTNTFPLVYKGHPLMRCGNTIYLGSMSEKYIIMMQVLSMQKTETLDMSRRIAVQLQFTDPDISANDKIVKSTEKDGLYNALDIATIWLERALSGR